MSIALRTGLLISMFVNCARGETPIYKTGVAMEKAMAAKVSWSSVGAPLGDQLRDLQQQAEVVILRDRRVDPHRMISLNTDFVPRIQVLRAISASLPDGGFCLTERLAFVGTAGVAHRLPILIARNNEKVNALRKKLNANTFRKLTTAIEPSWKLPAEPRAILMDYAKSVEVAITNPEVVPHDVWADGRLPKMTFAEMATLILNQFDLTLKIANDAARFTIVPIDAQESFEHRYTVGKTLKLAVAAEWQSRAPMASVKWTGSNAIVTTTLDQHAVLNSILSDVTYSQVDAGGSNVPANSLRTTLYSQFKVERATVGTLIEALRAQKVRIDVRDAEAAETKAILAELVQLSEITEKQPGTRFFPLLFGKHFKTVEVLDDRVILSRE